MLRLYSERDIARLELIKHLVGDLGLNLAGVRMAMRLFNQLMEVRERLPAAQGEAMRELVGGRHRADVDDAERQRPVNRATEAPIDPRRR